MFQTIISEYEVFYNIGGSPADTVERRSGYGITTFTKQEGKYKPCGFFSTDPKDYLRQPM